MGSMTNRVLLVLAGLVGLGCDPAEARDPKPDPPPAAASTKPAVRPVTTWLADKGWSAEERREGAVRRRSATVRRLFAAAGVAFPPRQLLFRGFKSDNELEVWAADEPTGPLRRVAIYEICAASGELGPKRREGDRQVPEGFYRVSFFHDHSRFHLAMRIDYPNAADRHHGHPTEPGSDIMIHGNCRSIGCLAMSDERIEELWVMGMALRSADPDAEVHVHLFPTREMKKLLLERRGDPHHRFWSNLREGLDRFEQNKETPAVSIDDGGRYRFSSGKN